MAQSSDDAESFNFSNLLQMLHRVLNNLIDRKEKILI